MQRFSTGGIGCCNFNVPADAIWKYTDSNHFVKAISMMAVKYHMHDMIKSSRIAHGVTSLLSHTLLWISPKAEAVVCPVIQILANLL
jgi:hypothetical protein